MNEQTRKPAWLRKVFHRYDDMSIGRSMLPALCLTFAISFLVMIYGPLELFFTNLHEFHFHFGMLFPELLQGFAVMLVAGMLCFLVCYILYVRLYDLAILAAGIAYICTYIQGMFMAGNLPPLDGRTMRWWLYGAQNVQSIVLWIVVTLAVILLVRFLHMRRMYKLFTVLPVFLTSVLLVTVVTLGIMNHGFSTKPLTRVTKDQEFTLSSDQNLVIFVVDTVDSWTFRQLLETDDPEFAEILSDFTYYPDTQCAYPYTMHAVPFILEGQWYENQMDYRAFVADAMDASPLLTRLRNENYRLGIYEDELNYESENALTLDNVSRPNCHFTGTKAILKAEMQLVWFKYAPFPLKKYVNINWDEFRNLLVFDGAEQFRSANWNFYRDLTAAEAEVVPEKCFRYYRVEGAHWPFRYDRDVNFVPVGQGTYYSSIEASMKMVSDYLDMLREAGVYDNTAILVMADHGFGYKDGEEVPLGRNNPLLCVKGMNEHHDTMQISEAPIAYDDLQEAYQRLLDGAGSDQVFDAKEGDERVRRYLYYDFTDEDHMVEYELHGHAEDVENLKPTGRTFDRKWN